MKRSLSEMNCSTPAGGQHAVSGACNDLTCVQNLQKARLCVHSELFPVYCEVCEQGGLTNSQLSSTARKLC